MTKTLQDIRFALRQLGKNLEFTSVAIVALALGIASATAIFSVIDVVLLHPLPYPESDRILSVTQNDRTTGLSTFDASPANYLDWVAQNHVFSVMAASRGRQGNIAVGDHPERIRMAMTSGNFFSLFGMAPMLGRGLSQDDAQAGHERVVVLSSGLWKRKFASDRGLIGRNITLDGQPYAVVGVMPANFSPDDYSDLWIPSPWDVPTHPLAPTADPRAMRDRNYLDVWARLKPGVTLRQASEDMKLIAARLEKQYPEADDRVGVGLVPMQELLVGDIRPVLLVLLAAVAFVLFIGCANVANLLLARAAGRSRELSIRAALGATRIRLVRQLLTESVLLALFAGILGALIAAWAVPALIALSPPEIRGFQDIHLNQEVLGFSLLLSALTGVIFGMAPALQSSRADVNTSLRDAERGSSGGRGRTRSALVIFEVGLSLVLLVGGGLLVRSFVRLMRVDPGFDPEHLLVFNVGLPPTSSPAQQDAFYGQVVEHLRETPGVLAAGAVSRLPLSGGNSARSFSISGRDHCDCSADIRVSTPDYFNTMRIPLLKGRNFTSHDSQGNALEAVVNDAFARQFFAGQDPVGMFISDFGETSEKLQIVGVVGNVRHDNLETAPRPEIYQPFGQAHWPSAFVAVRSKFDDPTLLITAAQSAVWDIDKSVPLANVSTMQQVIATSTLRRKFTMLLITIFASVALILAAFGLYGVMAYAVARRTREIGIRMALGARRGSVMRLIVGQGMSLVGVGILLGIIISLALTRLIARLLFGVHPLDLATFVAVSVVLATVALLANYIPARRAASIDPMEALRTE